MLLWRIISGFFKRLTLGWDDREWFYYTSTGFDPKLPAFHRWSVRLKDEEKVPETAAEELIRPHNYTVILDDKYGQTPEDLVFFTSELYKAQAVLKNYEKELRARSCGDFYYRMIKNRQLDFFHNLRDAEEPVQEGTAELDEDARRQIFNQ